MSTKLEKLREINLQLNTILKELEMKMFIMNIDITNNKKTDKDEKPTMAFEIK